MTGFFLPDRTPSAGWVAGIMLWFAVLPAMASEAIIVQSTTSTQNSGLYDYLLPLYQQQTANQVHVQFLSAMGSHFLIWDYQRKATGLRYCADEQQVYFSQRFLLVS